MNDVDIAKGMKQPVGRQCDSQSRTPEPNHSDRVSSEDHPTNQCYALLDCRLFDSRRLANDRCERERAGNDSKSCVADLGIDQRLGDCVEFGKRIPVRGIVDAVGEFSVAILRFLGYVHISSVDCPSEKVLRLPTFVEAFPVLFP